MGLLADRLAPARFGERRSTSGLAAPSDWLVALLGGGSTSAAGKRVTEGTALTVSAVFAAVRLLSFSVASLPLPLYRRLPRGKEKLTTHPLHRLLNYTPNRWQTALEFRAMCEAHLCLRGNAYVEIETTRGGRITALIPRHPDRIEVKVTPDERGLAYVHRPRQGPERPLAQEQVMHLRGLTTDGWCGLSVLAAARETLGLSMAAEEHAGRFYANDASPGGILSHPQRLSEEAKKKLRSQWGARHQGSPNAHKVAVLEEGMTWTAVGIAQKDQQFLEQRQFQVADVARWFNVPPHMIGELSRSTNNNIEQQSEEFVRYSLQPWLETWEQSIYRDLLTEAEQDELFVEHTTAALLRGQLLARSQAYAIGRQNGWLSADDVRDLENLNPLPDGQGEVYLVPRNMIPADKLDELVPAADGAKVGGGTPASAPGPVTTAGDGTPQPTRSAARAVRPDALAAAFLPALRDVAERCTRRETGEVQKAERKAPSGADGAWWTGAVFAEHEAYVGRALTPIVASCALALCPDVAPDAVLEEAAAYVARAAEREARAGVRRRLGEATEGEAWPEHEARRLAAHFTAWRARVADPDQLPEAA